MWYPAKLVEPVSEEPISVNDAMSWARIADDDILTVSALIRSARQYVEKYCGIRIPKQNLSLFCDDFRDFAHIQDVPIISVSSIIYTDVTGASQTLSPAVYDLRANDLEAQIAKVSGQAWPVTQVGSRINLAVQAGYETVPEPILMAIRQHVAMSYDNRENEKQEDWSAIDYLLCNYRR